MQKRKIINILACLIMIFVAIVGISVYKNSNTKSTSEENILKIEDELNDEQKKQSVTRLAATLTYGNESGENIIYYHILKTDYYEDDPSEMTGLNMTALSVLFQVESVDSREEMTIQEWPAALYKKGETAYLCWTHSPEVTYVLEYNPTKIQDSEIIKMAENAEEECE